MKTLRADDGIWQRALLVGALGAIAYSPGVTAQDIDSLLVTAEHFQLFNECAPIFPLAIVDAGEDSDFPESSADLRGDLAQALVEYRLRLANLSPFGEPTSSVSWFWVTIRFRGPSYLITAEYRKQAQDTVTDEHGYVTTWSLGGSGIHGGAVDGVLRDTDELVGAFTGEYLRVNADACNP